MVASLAEWFVLQITYVYTFCVCVAQGPCLYSLCYCPLSEDFLGSVQHTVDAVLFLSKLRDQRIGEYSKTNVPDLRYKARSQGLLCKSNLRKAEVIEFLVRHECVYLSWHSSFGQPAQFCIQFL